jgi:hypothetical protein
VAAVAIRSASDVGAAGTAGVAVALEEVPVLVDLGARGAGVGGFVAGAEGFFVAAAAPFSFGLDAHDGWIVWGCVRRTPGWQEADGCLFVLLWKYKVQG